MMTASNTSLSTPTSTGDDDGSQSTQGSSSSLPLSIQQALSLAQRMRADLKPHTKDRKWRLKSYASCFKATHAISWALQNISSDELIAVNNLNQLIRYGMLAHVVDPSKKIRVGETRTLYFRMVNSVLDVGNAKDINDEDCPGKGRDFGNDIHSVRMKSMDSMQQQISNIDHILQETVKELNSTRGKLELVSQEVHGLVNQQIIMFFMVLFMFIFTICFVVPTSGMGLLGTTGMGITMIISTRCGWKCISFWSDMESQTIPMEYVTISDDEEGIIVRTAKTFERKPTTSTISSLISKSIRSMTGSGKLQRSVSISREIFMREAYTLPEVKTWKHRPLMVCVNSTASPTLEVPDYGVNSCPIGVPFKFSSELFDGTCLIRLKGSNSDDPDGDAHYFTGRKRILQSVVQGRFKEELAVSEVMTGHEFSRPLKNLPHPFILKTATNFIGKVTPGANIVVHTDQPFVEATLGGTSQVVRGDQPGNEPSITCRDFTEDCSVFGGAFAKGNMSVARRKRLFANPAKCEDYKFDTETVYTFEFYQNLFDAQSYSLDLGFAKIGCSKVLNGQPIQWLGKMKDGRYLWNFQIWHEKLLPNG